MRFKGILVLAGCLFAQLSGAQQLKIVPVFGQQLVELGSASYTSMKGESLRFTNLGFYLSDFSWTDSSGKEIKQPERTELLQAEPEAESLILSAPIPAGRLCFRFGLDSALQVSGRMDGSLDPARGMYWAWNTGYIQFRLEGFSPDSHGKKGKFEFHLGGYAAPYATSARVCLQILPPTFPGRPSEIYLDLQSFFDALSLKKTYSVLVPGKEAAFLSGIIAKSFRSSIK